MNKIVKTFFILVVLVIKTESSSLAANIRAMRYREIDGATHHLYLATCIQRKSSVCSLRVMSVSTNKSPRACMITHQNLFESEHAQNPQKDTFSVTISGGGCNYSNTYVMSSKGLVQTKTSPAKVPENMKSVCETFTPKTYLAESISDSKPWFDNVPIGECKSVNIMME